ncbi:MULTISPECIES: LysR family transcriptional regulator [Enterobacteriaceae]|uniref:LysR family transcriptional regulator n=1 Tax=Salmonella enterica TaxID=28901 RepID=A0A5Y3ZW32_SALER|nr:MULTISPECIES: LysR family transcriptional regulator [Enterobacteriaceae]EBL0368773.1 LysR family transcriptional regulator [Salmonella enterica]ECO0849488.1 LysR family transcriptional regulator [Salmonella enterica subsp. enterica serovar Newport]EHK8846318.1 LysR family transcriptional regulator [Salmonella enterica subsp. enterica serovar Oslo]HED1541190.1 LysR family transcriptional regulator [Kluyvera cryocrescens]ECJ9215025.1 LysR family transcriptional regulator [Salmonella enterica]
MKRDEIADLMAFVAVAEERSFTRAAARLGMAQSALSQIVRRTEERLSLRLLTRTTRSVVPTEAGEHLLSVLGPMLHDIDSTLASLGDLRDRPSGTIRITTVEHAAKTILLPAMRTLLKSHPDINVQLLIDYGLTDVVSERFDAGVRLGGEMDKDMIAVRIGPDIPMAIVGAPEYLSRKGIPVSVAHLVDHQAINLYLPSSGTANRWRLVRGGREVRVRMEGQLLLNTIDLILDAAIDGHGLTYLPYDQVQQAIEEKKLTRVLEKFTPDLPGYHLYYPHRRHAGSAFSLLIDVLKYNGSV